MKGFIGVIIFLFRLCFSVVFILSGILKLVDPVGTGLIVREYCSAFHLMFLQPASVPVGVLLSVTELVVGMAVLVQFRMRVFSWLALCLAFFFTVITFILFKYNPIQDCGCFGEAVHLTNAQTFYKNLILLAFIIPVFLWRKKFISVSTPLFEWIFLGFHALFAAVLAVYSLETAPVVEFGDFKSGANIRSKLNVSGPDTSEDLYVYEKGGETRQFTLADIPDSTWNFVEVISSEDSTERLSAFDFSVSDAAGNDITDTIIRHSGPVFLFPVNNPLELEDGEWKEIVRIAGEVRDSACIVCILVPSMEMCDTSSISDMMGVCDYKTLLSLYRSNGGVVYMNDGIVVDKICVGDYSPEVLNELADSDYDEIISKNCIKGNMFLELVFIILLLDMMLFRYFCGIRYRKPEAGGKL